MDIQKELEYLLSHHWVNKDDNREMYYQIKSKLPKITDFVINKLGSKLIVNQEIIRIEKIPANIHETMALPEFSRQIDFVIFMLLLMFLEDKIKQEQFILSNLTTYITDAAITLDIKLKPDWNLYTHRKSLVDVLKYAASINMIKIKDGNNQKFADDIQNEVLYENMGISYYYIRRFNRDITEYETYLDFLKDEEDEFAINQNKRRNYIYRSLIYNPVFYFEGQDVLNLDYLRNYRNYIERDLSDNLKTELFIYKNMALISYESSMNKDYFPNSKAISDIVMLVNNCIIAEYQKNEHDYITISKRECKYFFSQVHDKSKELFSKEYREMPLERFYSEIISTMKQYQMVNEVDDTLIFSPLIPLLTGYFPYEEKEDNTSQLELLLEGINE